MNKNVSEAVDLAEEIKAQHNNPDVDVVLCPPFTDLYAVQQTLQGAAIALGAQDVFWEESGAFTGQVSADMLKSTGCEFVIIGHSERRQYFGEIDATVNKKIRQALKHKLTPILCVGELLQQREAGETQTVVEKQIRGAFEGLSKAEVAGIVLAYEPVWAIGTGKVATPAQAQDVHAFIRGLLVKLYDQEFADAVRIQYGGSMKPENAAELLAQKDIDGGLIGGAALKADSFIGIINA